MLKGFPYHDSYHVQGCVTNRTHVWMPANCVAYGTTIYKYLRSNRSKYELVKLLIDVKEE